jgi:acyl carrier protein
MSDVRTVILQAIADVAPDAELESLDPAADLRDELDIDSMDFLNVLVGIHERLGVEVPELDYGRVRTLEALVAYVDERRVRR